MRKERRKVVRKMYIRGGNEASQTKRGVKEGSEGMAEEERGSKEAGGGRQGELYKDGVRQARPGEARRGAHRCLRARCVPARSLCSVDAK